MAGAGQTGEAVARPGQEVVVLAVVRTRDLRSGVSVFHPPRLQTMQFPGVEEQTRAG